MRSCAWLICLLGCGRIGFDLSQDGATGDGPLRDGPPGDGPPGDGPPALVSVDPASLPPFGTIRRVEELSLEGINDDDPCLTRDQLEVFFESDRAGDENLYTATRSSPTGLWSVPVPINELNGVGSEEHPAISGDGLTLYFTSDRGGDQDLWFAIRTDRSSPFGPPILVSNVRSVLEDRVGSLDALDQSLFISSTRNGSEGLFEARRPGSSQGWQTPVLVPEIVASAGDPSVHIDDRGLAMYLVQNGSTFDLYWTTRPNVASSWVPPVPVTEINTGADESDPWLSPDLRTIYFVRDTTADKDIYTATR